MSDGRTPIRMVVLDAMGVIYSDGDDVGALALPFVRSKGCAVSAADIAAAYDDALVGVGTSTTFWNRLGMPNVDAEFLRLYTLTPGVKEFLKEMLRAAIPVGCISNDIAEWAEPRSRLLEIHPLIKPWVISGAVKLRKPDPAIYERFLQEAPFPAAACMFVDDRTSNLDAARALGFRTAHFHPSYGEDPKTHECVESFEELRALVTGERVGASGEG